MKPALKWMHSTEIEEPLTPDNPECCCVLMHAGIGEEGSAGADIFDFHALTPAFMARYPEAVWMRHQLVVQRFSWDEVRGAVSDLLSSTTADSWNEIALALARYMHWEFEDYKP